MMLLLALQVIAAGQAFTCTPAKVWDGDGPIHCAEGPRVHLAGIAAREMDGSCRPGHPCPITSPIEARDFLAGLLNREGDSRRVIAPSGHVLVNGPALECVSDGPAGGNRTAAWCLSPLHGDLACQMVGAGMALRWPRYWRGHRC